MERSEELESLDFPDTPVGREKIGEVGEVGEVRVFEEFDLLEWVLDLDVEIIVVRRNTPAIKARVSL